MKLFVTGGTGFIGSHFLNVATAQGFSIKALKRTSTSKPRISLKRNPEWLEKSLLEVNKEDLYDVDVIVHFAAHSANVPYDTLSNCIRYNVTEPLALFQKAHEAGVKRFVVAGSCFEYGSSGEKYDKIPINAPLEPTHSYPTSKAMATIAFKQFAIEKDVELSIHRIFQVFGEGELESRLWPSLRKAALEGKDFPMTKGEQIRDFINVQEVAKYFTSACQPNFENKEMVYNVGSGRPQTLLEFSQYWWSKWNAKGKLLPGILPYRAGEVMKYVPEI